MEITFIDLFGGAGGWSVGLESLGWKHLGLYELNLPACKTARQNFNCDVVTIDLSKQDAIDKITHRPIIVVGSPPCQGFSNEGKKKADDPRNNLVWKFFDIIDALSPEAWIFENVPGFKQSYSGKFFEALSERLDGGPYKWNHWILNAADYGVPQFRKRFVAVGAKRFLPQSPAPTHGESSDLFGLKSFVSLWDAISDLPEVAPGERTGFFSYTKPAHTPYQELMRKGSTAIHNHTTQKHSARVLEKIRHVEPGESMEKFVGKYEENKVSYCGGYRRALKWVPSWTAYWTRGMTSIHPDQDRFLSPRECARIQSFPDRHIFMGSTIENYTQVCNAVPPLLAAAVGSAVSNQMNVTG